VFGCTEQPDEIVATADGRAFDGKRRFSERRRGTLRVLAVPKRTRSPSTAGAAGNDEEDISGPAERTMV